MSSVPASPARRGPAPRTAVALELARAVGDLALLPARLIDFFFRRDALAAELREDLLRGEPQSQPPPQPLQLPTRRLRVFVSSAEASGEIHAAGLIGVLRRRIAEAGAPEPELVGLGGERLRAAGVRTLDDPVARATMGLGGALAALPYYLGLLERAASGIGGCDLAVLVDSPALHVPLGRMARRAGVPVLHLVAPQYWGWAPWRVAGYQRAVDNALTILPFEPAWFGRHGVPTTHIGHPLLDALPDQVPPPDDPQRKAIALLPGSRRSVVERNLPWMLAVLRAVRGRLGEVEVVLPHADAELVPLLRSHVERAGAADWVRLEPGDLHASLARARAAFSVSGTVLVDLLHQRLPTTVVYGLSNELLRRLYPQVLLTPWFALPNLLGGGEILPEFAFSGDRRRAEVGVALERCYNDEAWRRRCLAGLDRAARRLGPPGALERAAAAALDLLAEPSPEPPAPLS